MTVRVRFSSILLVFAMAARAVPAGSIPKAIREHQFTMLKGMTVENGDGEKLGVLADFALDLQTGTAEFGIVKLSGIGPLSKKRVVPAEYFVLGSVKAGILALDVTGNRWAKAPVFNAKNVQHLNEPKHRREIFAYYDHPGPGPHNPRDPGLRPSGRTDEQSAKARPMALAIDLLDNDVLDEKQTRLGKVSDILVDPQGRSKTMLIFSTGSFFSRGGRYAVPFDAVSVEEKNDVVILKHSIDLSKANPFDWNAATPDMVFAYP